MMLSKRMMKWVKDETTVSNEEAKMSMESYAIQVGIFEEDVKQLVEAVVSAKKNLAVLGEDGWVGQEACVAMAHHTLRDALKSFAKED